MYSIRNSRELVRNLSMRRVVIEEVPGIRSASTSPSGDSRRSQDVAAVAYALATWAPESILRYTEWRQLDDEWAAVVDTFGLARDDSLLRVLQAARSATEPASGPDGSDVRIMPVVVDERSHLTADKWSHGDTHGAVVDVADAEIVGGFMPTRSGRLLVVDETADPRRRAVAGQHQRVVCGSVRSTAAVVSVGGGATLRLDRGLLLAGRTDSNWYHFLVDTLPRLMRLESLPADIPLLVNAATPATGVDLLRRLTHREIVLLQSDTTYAVRHLSLVGGTSSVVDTEDEGRIMAPVYDLPALRWLRDRVSELDIPFDEAGGVLVVQRNGGVRSLRAGRLLGTVPALRDARRIDPSRSDLTTQIAAYRSCDVMVVPGGAALANMIFTRPTTTTIGLVGRVRPARPLWTSLSAVLERPYAQVPLRVLPAYRSLLPSHHRDVIVTPASAWRLHREIDDRIGRYDR